MDSALTDQNIFQLYCNSLTSYQRLKTLEVKIGDVAMGANHPIRVQSMTTTDTLDTKATVEQSIRMIVAGCEFVRITAPSINEARNLQNIKDELRKRGYKTPLIADIHFTPNAAETAARIVEKVRVNPGNYADKKKFDTIEYTDVTYAEELERIRERFIPLVKICKEYGTAMRIGTNHGSLSDRIMSRYGDTPLGMVESALEFLRICMDEGYYSIVLSMKASNPQVMVQAYRLLIAKMRAEFMDLNNMQNTLPALFPLHLGVTEAGEAEDGRIKSASGIGTLLEDGIGDTIRVSLTEDPELEIPVAQKLVSRYNNRTSHQTIKPINHHKLPYSPFSYSKRLTKAVLNVGGNHVPVVIADFSGKQNISPASLFPVGYNYSQSLDKWHISDQACDFIYVGNQHISFALPGTLGVIYNNKMWLQHSDDERTYPLFNVNELNDALKCTAAIKFIELNTEDFFKQQLQVDKLSDAVLVLKTSNDHAMPDLRNVFVDMMQQKNTLPVIIKRDYAKADLETFRLHCSTDAGALLLDGMGDGVWLCSELVSPADINQTAFGILQAARTRISKTEYISCPSCGRTLFDLQETTAKIRARTHHLKGIKIGIMGCIVNGPGEMADADYGYVGSGAGKITLYKGKEVVRRNIDAALAVDALIELIRDNGDWIEPAVITPSV
ncbi:MAG TPA: (E)-4-hydroxy-3-methylbut-2-enyl-diphosphate synthase [Bacteroidia bacterium]|nr:(E)-4-hydroxy-3-methylbut-2-enyl-diphosphate synthase [Bacteroidia bacterium]QQR94592.1 MAG: (E)-4-hydroxy-3-methylbut-2-enyl-diphosphate synthase [Bacteroidota bacterium]MBP7714166.1 (E)-4-hydroxy-3-methylbut-2-enyl-diphosphate synthase [Bacteroidia bacterium]MBP8668820.1 (E)-4-hydroxy-3-methylbut-2-enyl-diphosphate synthase [Bacteroidia bacterium]HOZ82958.1 (E)-4-hydroxy-3-methylbut-2-enyl-diphosphate synthase [Bacteroidia bacterium]